MGFSLRNLGPNISFVNEKQSDPLPGLIDIGVAYTFINTNTLDLILASDFEKHINESSTLDYIRIGSEVNLFNLLNLRFGYVLDTYGIKNSYSTIGAGLNYKFID